MKATIFLIFIIPLTLSEFYDIEAHTEMVNKINKLRTTWTAKVNYRDYTPFLGAVRTTEEDSLPEKTDFKYTDDELPSHYDCREEHPECPSLKEIRDQSKCGSCWAHSSGEVMTDRLCIASKGEIQFRVSTLDILSCCGECGNGCFGGWPSKAFKHWIREGFVSGNFYGDKTTCKPYFLPECDDHMHKCHDYVDTPKCTKKCIPEYQTEYEEDKSYGTRAYSIRGGMKNIMKEIMENGPVSAIYDIYEDFVDYEKGIYQHVTGRIKGSHAVKIIGWGEEKGVLYWLVANSWNERWGENGYFRILRGVNECGIELSIDAALPRV